MPNVIRLVDRLPIPKELKLAWQRDLIDKYYAKDIAAARNANDQDKVHSLARDHQFEIDLHDEEEDAFITEKLLKQARRFRVPIPHRHTADKTESDHWGQGRYTGHWLLRKVCTNERRPWLGVLR